jgi:hypothetical protein
VALHADHRPALSHAALSIKHAVILLVAGLVAGTIGTAGGITSLVSYPALLAIGVPPFAANATNLVALVTFWPGSAHGSKRELGGHGRWLLRWTPVMVAGGGVGAVLLLVTPSEGFEHVVPFLVLAGSVALICAPRLARGRTAGSERGWMFGAWLAVLGLYGGYFGAGAGVMTLALLLTLVEPHVPTANALKNMLVGAAAVPAAILIAIFAPVRWPAAAALAAGVLIGSRLGPGVARRVPSDVLRWTIATLGVGLAVFLWLKPGG